MPHVKLQDAHKGVTKDRSGYAKANWDNIVLHKGDVMVKSNVGSLVKVNKSKVGTWEIVKSPRNREIVRSKKK